MNPELPLSLCSRIRGLAEVVETHALSRVVTLNQQKKVFRPSFLPGAFLLLQQLSSLSVENIDPRSASIKIF